MTKEQINMLGSVGPFARASGVKADMRKLGYAAYPQIDFEPITSEDGDSYARCYVRMMEIFQSIDIIRQAIAKLPSEKDLVTPVKGNPNGEAFVRLEQPRGEAFYYAKANGTPFLERMRVRTPTFANIAGLCEMLKNTELSDVGLLVLTIDPCISCTER
jgi:ech hydrogenase subunit E